MRLWLLKKRVMMEGAGNRRDNCEPGLLLKSTWNLMFLGCRWQSVPPVCAKKCKGFRTGRRMSLESLDPSSFPSRAGPCANPNHSMWREAGCSPRNVPAHSQPAFHHTPSPKTPQNSSKPCTNLVPFILVITAACTRLVELGGKGPAHYHRGPLKTH